MESGTRKQNTIGTAKTTSETTYGATREEAKRTGTSSTTVLETTERTGASETESSENNEFTTGSSKGPRYPTFPSSKFSSIPSSSSVNLVNNRTAASSLFCGQRFYQGS